MNLGYLSSPNRWAYFMISVLSMLVAGYIIWHIIDRPGSKNVMLTAAEQTDIQNILDDFKPEGNNSLRGAIGSDSLTDKSKAIAVDEYEHRREQVYLYITQTHTMLDTSDKAILRATLKLMPDERSLRSYLNTHPVRVYSPYHLNGRSMLWELICWALFGVICNLFYSVSEAYKGTEVKKSTSTESKLGTEPDNVELVLPDKKAIDNSLPSMPERLRRRFVGGFDPAEVPSQIAKLIYTPFLVVIIYLALVSFNSTTDLEWVQYGEGVIVFAFVIGFFSGRMVDLLERIKDLFLPIGRFGNEPPINGQPAPTGKSPGESEQEPKSELKVVPDLAAADGAASDGQRMLFAKFASDNLPPAPISGFAELKIKYRLELDKPTRKLKFFNLGDFPFLSVVLQQLDSTKLIYSNEKLDTTLDVLSNDVAGTPDFFKIFVQFKIDRGGFGPDPALDCFLFLFYIEAGSGKSIPFPVHQPNSRNATLTFRMGSSGLIHIHEDVLWTSPQSASSNDVSTPAAELPVV